MKYFAILLIAAAVVAMAWAEDAQLQDAETLETAQQFYGGYGRGYGGGYGRGGYGYGGRGYGGGYGGGYGRRFGAYPSYGYGYGR